MGYELKRADIEDFARFAGAETRERGDELQFRLCPVCKGGDHRDQWTFSINLTSGLCNCPRGQCGYRANFVQLCRDMRYPLDYGEEKTYRKYPPRPKVEVRDGAVDYLGRRGISAETVRAWRVTTHKSRPHILVFPFFDEKGDLRAIKYRNTQYVKGVTHGSKEWTDPSAMPLLYGMDMIGEQRDELVITEGQIDALSLYECGIKNAVSVPMGKTNFAWYANCKHFVESFKSIVVFGDREGSRITLVDELSKRLPGTILLKQVPPAAYLDRKDANDILTRYGADEVRKAYEAAELPRIERVTELSEVPPQHPRDYRNVLTGFTQIDSRTNGILDGQVMLITGRSGNGKSTFMSQMVCNFLQQRKRVFIYSGEMTPTQVRHEIELQLAGPKHIYKVENTKSRLTEYYPDEAAQKLMAQWYKGFVYLYTNNDDEDGETQRDTLLQTIERAVCANGIEVVCVDNLMTAITESVTRQEDMYLAQSKFVSRLKRMAAKYGLYVILIAHPRKTTNKELENDDVSGSSDIVNKVDISLTYARVKDNPAVQAQVQITKNREYGELAVKKEALNMRYEPGCKRIYGELDRAEGREYGWTSVMTEITEEELPF